MSDEQNWRVHIAGVILQAGMKTPQDGCCLSVVGFRDCAPERMHAQAVDVHKCTMSEPRHGGAVTTGHQSCQAEPHSGRASPQARGRKKECRSMRGYMLLPAEANCSGHT